MKEIKRYNTEIIDPHKKKSYEPWQFILYSECPNGILVFYQDHKTIVKELQAKIESLELKLKYPHDICPGIVLEPIMREVK